MLTTFTESGFTFSYPHLRNDLKGFEFVEALLVLKLVKNTFFSVGPSKEDIFSGHHLNPVFQSSLHITNTNYL